MKNSTLTTVIISLILNTSVSISQDSLKTYIFCQGIPNRHLALETNSNVIAETYIGFDMSQGKLKVVNVTHKIIEKNNNEIIWLNDSNPKNRLEFTFNFVSLSLTIKSDSRIKYNCFFFESEAQYNSSIKKEKQDIKDRLLIY